MVQDSLFMGVYVCSMDAAAVKYGAALAKHVEKGLAFEKFHALFFIWANQKKKKNPALSFSLLGYY